MSIASTIQWFKGSSLYPKYLGVYRFIARKKYLPVYFRPPNAVLPPFFANFLLRPFPFLIWYRLRELWWSVSYGVHTAKLPDNERHDQIERIALPYNLRRLGQFASFGRRRTEVLLRLFPSITSLDMKTAKVLDVGPRTEFEPMLMALYGFKFKNIEVIDLISNAPAIKLMDMHNLSYPDNTFDIVYCAYTIRYGHDLKKICDGWLRVLKPGGLVAVIFTTDHDSRVNDGADALNGIRLDGGPDELLAQFEGHVDSVIWCENVPMLKSPHNRCSMIFRVRK